MVVFEPFCGDHDAVGEMVIWTVASEMVALTLPSEIIDTAMLKYTK